MSHDTVFINTVKPRNTQIPNCTVNWDEYIEGSELNKIMELRRQLRSDPKHNKEFYESLESLKFVRYKNFNTQCGSSPRLSEFRIRMSGGIMDVSPSDFIPSNKFPAGVPVDQVLDSVKPGAREMMLMRRWKKLHAPLLHYITEKMYLPTWYLKLPYQPPGIIGTTILPADQLYLENERGGEGGEETE